jgi:macrodomain Ter protein organizer (MatP/YcbG family)
MNKIVSKHKDPLKMNEWMNERMNKTVSKNLQSTCQKMGNFNFIKFQIESGKQNYRFLFAMIQCTALGESCNFAIVQFLTL